LYEPLQYDPTTAIQLVPTVQESCDQEVAQQKFAQRFDKSKLQSSNSGDTSVSPTIGVTSFLHGMPSSLYIRHVLYQQPRLSTSTLSAVITTTTTTTSPLPTRVGSIGIGFGSFETVVATPQAIHLLVSKKNEFSYHIGWCEVLFYRGHDYRDSWKDDTTTYTLETTTYYDIPDDDDEDDVDDDIGGVPIAWNGRTSPPWNTLALYDGTYPN
jgi:hypothetical protein